ncbi:MAG: hypothetical protein ACUZ8N_13205 [Candidatus Scalindua sp.]
MTLKAEETPISWIPTKDARGLERLDISDGDLEELLRVEKANNFKNLKTL